ncbi:hypothetical protein LOTGIDRAFT_208867 [Lottia gigantea]|uniref:Solute-binding protein family 3/N-terminal domain-containing protein n=1 Tax=Lottia gigantea TaxID=225164 RepID=V4A1M7_LOTGI|nr:hypothetical protein LOTGIDRAFT_208867 [Lottia gigantea]ESO97728.1 hypothetical protein LOTGIDRAFT_208867 [Lottia gigantea]
MSASAANPQPKKAEKLRLITYLSPGIPIELFETLMHYLEQVTGREAYIIHESRWSCPPSERVDLFTTDEVDIGFMCGSGYIRLRDNPNVELCKAAPLHIHKNSQNRPVYFSDVIIDSSNKLKYKEFQDLKGHKWAYNDNLSVSGNLIVLKNLKQMGVNSTFFGNILCSGSHLKSIEMVLDGTVDAAAIDSNTLSAYLKSHPHLKDRITIITSFGPMPVYPVVFNSRLPGELKDQITKGLLEINKKPEWKEKLLELGVNGYIPIDSSLYNLETELVDLVKGLSIVAAYY